MVRRQLSRAQELASDHRGLQQPQPPVLHGGEDPHIDQLAKFARPLDKGLLIEVRVEQRQFLQVRTQRLASVGAGSDTEATR